MFSCHSAREIRAAGLYEPGLSEAAPALPSSTVDMHAAQATGGVCVCAIAADSKDYTLCEWSARVGQGMPALPCPDCTQQDSSSQAG